MTPLEALKRARRAHPTTGLGIPRSIRFHRAISLFLLGTLFAAAIGIGTTSGSLAGDCVFVFLAAVAGIVAIGFARTMTEARR